MTYNISLIEFLKTYTAISNKFIDSYYRFYEICETNKFGIEASKVIKYLGLTYPKKFYERLRTNYIINSDYIIKKKNQKLISGEKNTFYYLSFDGFEKVCMSSTSKKGNSVRDYFITLRKFIEYYRQNIANNINNMAKKGKCIYIILANKNKSIFKVGRTNDMRRRLYSYATGKDKHPDIKFIMLIEDAKKVEDCIKVFVNKYKFRGKQELYKIDLDILKNVIFDCAILNEKFNEMIKNNNDLDSYIIYNEAEEYLDKDYNNIGYNMVKQTSKKPSKKISKKTSKKTSKK
jgi:phage anti-repressor protein